MALLKCPKCNNTINDKALVCMYCGFPVTIMQKEQVSELRPINQSALDETNDTLSINCNTYSDRLNSGKVYIMDINCPRCNSNQVKLLFHKSRLYVDCKKDKVIKICRRCEYKF